MKTESFEDQVLEELEEFRSKLSDYLEGKDPNPNSFKTYRLKRGVYGQRQDDEYMLRIRVPYGRLSGDQLHQIANIIDTYSERPDPNADAGNVGHITTRQAIQIHFIKMKDVPAIQQLLAEVGLTGRDACGDAVRNIVAPALAGVDPTHPFDITPYADWVNQHCLRNPELVKVPRKFKISFAGSPEERSQTLINDIGFEARLANDRERGFRVTLGGGLGVPPTLAKVLYEFVPEAHLVAVTRAILDVFINHTDASSRKRMRFKFIIRRLGWDKTVELINQNLQKHLTNQSLLDLPERGPQFLPRQHSVESIHHELLQNHTDEKYTKWIQSSIHPQVQPGLAAIRVHTDRGDLDSIQWRSLAELAKHFGQDEVRADRDQNVVLPHIQFSDLPLVYDQLSATNLLRIPAGGLIDPVSCPGGDTCNLAVTKSRSLARKIEDSLASWTPYADQHTTLRISGCPNSCGQHMTATIGFWGTAKRLHGRLVPCYELMIGGGDDGQGNVQLSKMVGRVPSRAVPDVLDILLAYYLAHRGADEKLSSFFARADRDEVKHLLQPFFDLSDVPEEAEHYFQEWYSNKPFVIKKGESECAA